VRPWGGRRGPLRAPDRRTPICPARSPHFHRQARNPVATPGGVRMLEWDIPVPENQSIM